MSDFQKFLEEQLKDPKFHRLWEARNEMILQRTAGSMSLSGMDLTEEDKARILYLCEHPDEMDAMLENLIRKHKVTSATDEKIRTVGSELIEKHIGALQELAKGEDH